MLLDLNKESEMVMSFMLYVFSRYFFFFFLLFTVTPISGSKVEQLHLSVTVSVCKCDECTRHVNFIKCVFISKRETHREIEQ